MASPWKFFARLTSRRLEQKPQQNAPTDELTSEEATSAETVEAVTDGTPNSAELRVGAEPQPDDQSDAVSPEPEQPAEAGTGVQGRGDRYSAEPSNTIERTQSNLGPVGASVYDVSTGTYSNTARKSSRRRNRETKPAEPGEIDGQPLKALPAFPNEIERLDEEIIQLRGELARRLRLQNAQLRKMLERFEP